MSFETNVTLGIEVDSGELRSAKRAIEDELGDVTVGVDGGGAASRATSGGGGGGRSGQRSRRLFRWARQRTGYAEETVELLTQIEENLDEGGALGGGGGGGGGGSGLLPLGIGRATAGIGGLGLAGGLGMVTATGLTIAGTIAASAIAIDEIVGAETIVGDPSKEGQRTGAADVSIFGPSAPFWLDTLLNMQDGGGFTDIKGTGSTFDTPSTAKLNQMLEKARQEPAWLQKLEQIFNKDLRIDINGNVVVDDENMMDEISEQVRAEIADEIDRGMNQGSKTSRWDIGR